MSLEPILNPKETEPFVSAIGRLIVNMGHIELLTFLYLERIDGADVEFGWLARRPLKKRVRAIIGKIRALDAERFPQASRDKALEMWQNILEGADLRNSIAHGACVFSRTSNEGAETSSLSGVLTFLPKDNTREAELISLEELDRGASVTATIAQVLHDALKSLERVDF